MPIERLAASAENRPALGFCVARALLALVLASVPARAQALDEREAVRRICGSGPDRTLATATRMQGAARISEASVLPNPSLVLEHQETLRGGTERETIIGVALPLGLGGRRFLLQDAAEQRRQQAELEASATLFEAALAFREAYVAAAVAQSRLQVLIEQQTAFDALSAVIANLSRAGETAGYDLLRHETQARLHRQVVESARADVEAAMALLETWTGVEVPSLRTSLGALAGGARIRQVIDAALAEQHPRVRQLEAQSQASALEARAARRRWVPDLEVFAGYRRATLGSGTGDGLSVALSIPVTLFDHGQGEAALAEAEQALSRTAAASLRRQYRARLKSARARLRVLEATAGSAETTASGAARVRGKAQQLYAAGEASITELLEAFRDAEQARLALVDLWNEVAQARLAVMRSTGSFFDAELDRECGATGSNR